MVDETWHNVVVGDIIRLENNHFVTVLLLLLLLLLLMIMYNDLLCA